MRHPNAVRCRLQRHGVIEAVALLLVVGDPSQLMHQVRHLSMGIASCSRADSALAFATGHQGPNPTPLGGRTSHHPCKGGEIAFVCTAQRIACDATPLLSLVLVLGPVGLMQVMGSTSIASQLLRVRIALPTNCPVFIRRRATNALAHACMPPCVRARARACRLATHRIERSSACAVASAWGLVVGWYPRLLGTS